VIALSDDMVVPGETVIVDLALADPDLDALTSECHAIETSVEIEEILDSRLTKVSETQYTFLAPITQSRMAEIVFRCTATDDEGEVSDVTESSALSIDNAVPGFEDFRNFAVKNVCRENPYLCRMDFHLEESLFDIQVPDTTDIPDQFLGARFEMPTESFEAFVNVEIPRGALNRSLLSNSDLPSVIATVGADDDGRGYVLEVIPTQVGTSVTWKWEVRSLGTSGMRAESFMAGTVLASGAMGNTEPATIQTLVQNGTLSFSINGAFNTPALSASNMMTSSVSYGTRSASAAFTDATAAMKP
jgi:hypothetical protein